MEVFHSLRAAPLSAELPAGSTSGMAGNPNLPVLSSPTDFYHCVILYTRNAGADISRLSDADRARFAEREIVRITAADALGALTMLRAQDGTTARQWLPMLNYPTGDENAGEAAATCFLQTVVPAESMRILAGELDKNLTPDADGVRLLATAARAMADIFTRQITLSASPANRAIILPPTELSGEKTYRLPSAATEGDTVLLKVGDASGISPSHDGTFSGNPFVIPDNYPLMGGALGDLVYVARYGTDGDNDNTHRGSIIATKEASAFAALFRTGTILTNPPAVGIAAITVGAVLPQPRFLNADGSGQSHRVSSDARIIRESGIWIAEFNDDSDEGESIFRAAAAATQISTETGGNFIAARTLFGDGIYAATDLFVGGDFKMRGTNFIREGMTQARVFNRFAAPTSANNGSAGFRIGDLWLYPPYSFVAVARENGDIDWADDEEGAWMILSDIHAIGSVTAAGALVANANGILPGYREFESASRTASGRYTLTFPSQPGNSANYVAQATFHDSQPDSGDDITAISALAATSIRVHVYNGVGASVNDSFFITVYRAQ